MAAHLDLDDVAAQSPLAQRELQELRRDAERYRWMRDCENGSGPSGGIPYDDTYGGWERVDWLYEDQLDDAIDADMAAAPAVATKEA